MMNTPTQNKFPQGLEKIAERSEQVSSTMLSPDTQRIRQPHKSGKTSLSETVQPSLPAHAQ